MEILNTKNYPLIIWIDKNIYNKENQGYLKQLGINNIFNTTNHSETIIGFNLQINKNNVYKSVIFSKNFYLLPKLKM